MLLVLMGWVLRNKLIEENKLYTLADAMSAGFGSLNLDSGLVEIEVLE